MARIPSEEIAKLKTEVSIERLAEARGVVLDRLGDELVGLCLFHEDTESSLVIDPVKNTWQCRGACQSGGSVIDWVMKVEGVSFRHAVELLRDGALSLTAESGTKRVPKRATIRKLDIVVESDVAAHQQLRQVIGYYHETLKQSPEALAYLEKRGLRSAEMIDRFRLGFVNRTLGYHLPSKDRRVGAELRKCLMDIGILRKNGHEQFRGSLVIPVMDENGTVTEVYGRKISNRRRKGTPIHLYLPGPHHV